MKKISVWEAPYRDYGEVYTLRHKVKRLQGKIKELRKELREKGR